MIETRNIQWYLSDPNRLLQMKPFTRGGDAIKHYYEDGKILNNNTIDVGLPQLELNPISQDRYITEYRPDLHKIIHNESIPHIKVTLNGSPMSMGVFDMTITSSHQKLIHAAHVRSLTSNPLEFSLCKDIKNESALALFDDIKSEWAWRNNDWWLAQAINTCKQLGNCGLLFSFDKKQGQYRITSFSYEDGYQIIPNYDEYGYEVACSLVCTIDGQKVIDTFDNKYHYRILQNKGGKGSGWTITRDEHGFSRCPLLHKRGKVAWEYAESSIEMWEIMKNIQAVALKRFGTFALVLVGDMDTNTFMRDSSTLVINLSSDTTNGKQDAKILDIPESKTMDEFIKGLERDISLFSSTSFITPSDISTSYSGGNGIALAMSNDYSLATQSALDWRKFVNDMVFLHQEGLALEDSTKNYNKLRIGAKIIPWSLETNNTKITNLQMEAKWLSMQTIIEKSPDAAPDEIERIVKERGSLVPSDAVSDADTEKAANISKNRSNEIVDNIEKPVTE